MKIQQTRVQNIERYIGAIPKGTLIRILTDISDDVVQKIARVGFLPNPVPGATILPAVVGRTTRRNSEGFWKVRKDLPKENRFLYTRLWRRTDWQGNISEDYIDVERFCYQRELVPPASVEVSLHNLQNKMFIVSPPFVAGDDDEMVKHVVNLFLELFGVCEIISVDISAYSPRTLETVNWRFLPPGEHPWGRLKEHLAAALQGTSADTKTIIQDRAETIRGYEPDRLLIGQGGFRDYIAYDFSGRGCVILKSVQKDNAMYVFGSDWPDLSKRTKAELIAGSLYQDRIVHRLGWKSKLAALMKPKSGAPT